MSIRINHAKNFRGKAYVAADELDNLIKSMTLAGASVTGTADVWKIQFTTADGSTPKANAVDLTGIKEYIDNKAINVTAGAGVAITGDALHPVISANVDNKTIVLSGEGNDAKLASGLKIVKRTTTTEGYAASYTLADKDGNEIAGAGVIDIVKDQFIKSAQFGWADTATSEPSNWNAQKAQISGTAYPCIKIEVWTNTDGNAGSSDTTATTIYVPLNDVFTEYTARNGVTITDDSIIEGVVDTANSEKVYTAKGTSAAVLEVGAAGFKVANIQAAIDNAVTAEHETASAAIETLEGAVKSFADNTSAAVTTLNTRIETVAGNAQTAAGNAQANAIKYASDVADNAQGAIRTVGAAVDALDTKVSEAIATVNTNVEKAIDDVVVSVNTAINANVADVNTNVGNAVASVNQKVNGSIDNVNTQVTVFKEKVNATVVSVKTAMDNLVTGVNDAVSARSTQLTNAVEVVDSAVTPALKDGTTEYSATVTAKYVLAVYGNDSLEIYPEIKKNADGTFTLTADYGAVQGTVEPWNVICVKPLPAYTGASMAVTGYDNNIAYTAAEKATDATYSPVEKTDAAAVDAANVNYIKGDAVAGTTVAKGSEGTAVTDVGKGDAATPPATTGIAVEKEVPKYKNEA